MERLRNKHILLGVTGSVAAYKAAELVRRLREAGAEVQVVMTRGAEAFVTPLSFQSLSGRPVRSTLMDTEAEAGMGHIELARWADAIVVAPASADFIARLTQGRADDLLTAVCLASEAPLALAPAMNRLMWQDAATRENCLTLRRRGVRLFGPAEGSQACGETGPGRMLEPGDIALRTAALFESGALTGQKVIITAGPTLEDIDPVRYIGNRSSGKMGYALAAAAAEAGAEVVLISGPTSLEPPPRVTLIKVRSAQQMLEAVESQLDDCQVFIAAAAVADYRPRLPATEKFKRSADTLTLQLEPTPDILSSVVRYGDVFTVGFAAETGDVVSLGEAKLLNKQVDMLVANRVGQDDAGQSVGFENDNNEVHVMWQGGSRHFPRQRKGKLAVQLIALITERYHAKQDSAQSA